VKIALRAIFLSAACFCIAACALPAAELPHLKMENGTGQLIVNGQPFLILGGEPGNSSAVSWLSPLPRAYGRRLLEDR
jgi:hypothetical protein